MKRLAAVAALSLSAAQASSAPMTPTPVAPPFEITCGSSTQASRFKWTGEKLSMKITLQYPDWDRPRSTILRNVETGFRFIKFAQQIGDVRHFRNIYFSFDAQGTIGQVFYTIGTEKDGFLGYAETKELTNCITTMNP